MPVRKTRLNATETAIYQSRFNRLKAESFNFGEQLEVFSEACPLVITDGSSASWAKAVGENVVYGISARLTSFASITIEDVEIECSFDPSSIQLPFLITRAGFCKFAGSKYRECELLNPLFDYPCRISKGKVIDGLLLAYGAVPVPANLGGQRIQILLRLIDVFGRTAEQALDVAAAPQSSEPRARIVSSDRLLRTGLRGSIQLARPTQEPSIGPMEHQAEAFRRERG